MASMDWRVAWCSARRWRLASWSPALSIPSIPKGLCWRYWHCSARRVFLAICRGTGPLPGRRGSAKRRARIYMGDSGALALGGMLAMIAIFSRNEWSLLLIGGAFVLEGASALIQSRILTRFYRDKLQMLRFTSLHERVPHT